MSVPRIAILLDENTSGDATLYEAPKTLFRMIVEAGGLPLGISYAAGLEATLVDDFDGLISPGGRFAFPQGWYAQGRASSAPFSERCDFDLKLMRLFLEADKPVLGICSGMQMMAGLAGCTLVGDIRGPGGEALVHNGPAPGVACTHDIAITPGSRLATVMGTGDVTVNSLHNEAVIEVPSGVAVTARALDGVIEAIELEGKRFALGVQWHLEKYHGQSHSGNALFDAFIAAARP